MRGARGTRGTIGVMHWHKSVLVVGVGTLVQQGLEFRKASQLARKPTTPKTQYVEFSLTERIQKVRVREKSYNRF